MLGVDPKLVEQIHQRHDSKQQGRHAQRRHGQVKNPTQQGAGRGLAQGGGQVVVLALVVRHVGGPKQRHLMPGAVQPVVTKIVKNQCQAPPIPMVPERGLRPQGDAAKHGRVDRNTNKFAKDARHLAQHAHAQAAQGVTQAVAAVCR